MRQQHRSIQVQTLLQHIVFIQKPLTAFMIFTPFLFPISLVGILSLYAISVNPFLPVVTVHARVPSNGICRGFTFKYGKFLLPPRFLTALSVPKVPTRELYLPVPYMWTFLHVFLDKRRLHLYNKIPNWWVKNAFPAWLKRFLLIFR